MCSLAAEGTCQQILYVYIIHNYYINYKYIYIYECFHSPHAAFSLCFQFSTEHIVLGKSNGECKGKLNIINLVTDLGLIILDQLGQK